MTWLRPRTSALSPSHVRPGSTSRRLLVTRLACTLLRPRTLPVSRLPRSRSEFWLDLVQPRPSRSPHSTRLPCVFHGTLHSTTAELTSHPTPSRSARPRTWLGLLSLLTSLLPLTRSRTCSKVTSTSSVSLVSTSMARVRLLNLSQPRLRIHSTSPPSQATQRSPTLLTALALSPGRDQCPPVVPRSTTMFLRSVTRTDLDGSAPRRSESLSAALVFLAFKWAELTSSVLLLRTLLVCQNTLTAHHTTQWSTQSMLLLAQLL